MTPLTIVALIIISIIFIAFFSGYEIAFITANRLNIELKKKQGKSNGIIVSKFVEHPAKFIGSCVIGLNIFTVIYGLMFDDLLNKVLWNNNFLHFLNKYMYIRLVFNTILSAFIILMLGEVFPKAIFRTRNDSWVIKFAPAANFFHRIFQPLASFLVGISEWILKYIFNLNIKPNTPIFSKVDLENFFQQNKDSEDDAELNTELFENALSLPSVKIRQCLVPRTEVEAVEMNMDIEEVKQHFITTQLSKLIVYKDTIDEVVGYIHQLDMFKKPSSIKEILLPISAVPEAMSATDLMNKFTKERKSIAWVVDEFGGTAGIVTLEDVLEEIFGEIKDEYDVEEFVEKQLNGNEFIFSGRLELDYLKQKYALNLPNSNESETLSGYIINQHETIPKPTEKIITGNYQFDILNVSDTRIELVKMKKL